jgi:PIN domain nuclease of toxin-antitoxin system
MLDTHVLAWWWSLDARLGKSARATVADPDNTVLVSAVTPWEMAIKHATGRWPAATSWLDRWDEFMREDGFETLPIHPRHGIHAAALEWSHRDPFDRILVAQARLEGARLITADAWMLAFLPDALNASEG